MCSCKYSPNWGWSANSTIPWEVKSLHAGDIDNDDDNDNDNDNDNDDDEDDDDDYDDDDDADDDNDDDGAMTIMMTHCS